MATFVLATCERFGCLPSQLYAEQGELLRLIAIEAMGRPDNGEAPFQE